MIDFLDPTAVAHHDDRPACTGGAPVRTAPWPTYDQGAVMIDEDDIRAAERAVRSQLLFRYDTRPYEQTETGMLELEMAEFLGSRFALATTSGTTALTLALMGSGVGPGDVVGCPAFTFPAAASAVAATGAEVRLVEVDENLNMDTGDLSTKLPAMKALIVCHMRGVASDIEAIKELTDHHGVILIEDAVPVFGTTYAGRKLGTFGAVGCFSFQADKAINSGEGGLVVTDDQETFERMCALTGTYEGRLKRHLDARGLPTLIDERSLPIMSWRMDEVRAAIARSQLAKSDRRRAAARRNHDLTAAAVDRLAGWRRRVCPTVGDGMAGDSMILFAPEGSDASALAAALRAEGIPGRCLGDPTDTNARCFWNWLFCFPGTTERQRKALAPRSATLLARAIDIPLSPLMTDTDRADLIAALGKVAGLFTREAAA